VRNTAGLELPGLVADGIRAVLFDVDGTLYHQNPVRALMAGEMALHGLRSLRDARRVARIVRTFRRTREQLREVEGAVGGLETLQYEQAAFRLEIQPAEVRAVVEEWMLQRPLKHLRIARRRGVTGLLQTLTARGIRAGALSDYPVEDKLRALGIAAHFSLQLCTTDRAIDAFKPHPKGFWHACTLWGVAPEEVLYVGDRPEVDGVGAAAAGTRCVIVSDVRRGGDAAGHGGAAVVAALADVDRAFATAR
jgi:HAD superfamily hydrolase (TIGR01549 family)